MAIVPNRICPTLAAADAQLVASQDTSRRAYLGMSAIGSKCERALWLGFRWATNVMFDAATLKRFVDGHASEAVAVARLAATPELEVHAVGDDGEQFGHIDLGGHFRGHMDGVVLGLKQAPKTWHVLEIKASEKGVAELQKAIATVGEKLALRHWNAVYYAQAVLYMHYAGLDRHYLVVCTPGARDWAAVRTDADPAFALALIAKAERIVFGEKPPARIGDRNWFECRFCDHFDTCHGDTLAQRNCRTCMMVTPERDGTWSCALDPENVATLSIERQRKGCASHRFIPALIDAEQIDASQTGITYRTRDGGTWIDEGPGQ